MRRYAALLLLSLILLPALPLSTEAEEFELRFELMVLSWDDWSVHTGEVLAQQLEKVGIKLEVTPLDDSVMYPRIDARDYWMAEEALGYDMVPTHMFYRFHSSQDFEGGGNYMSYRNPEYDSLVEQALATTDKDEARDLMRQAQAILAEDLPYLPLFITKDIHPFYKGWEGIVAMSGGSISSANKLTVVNMHHPEKNTFVMAYPSFPRSLNPMPATDGRSLWYAILVYDSLLIYDENLNLIPWLAESYEVSEDGKTITFVLREGVKWHDGQPVTAEDVAFTFNFAKENEAYGSFYVDIPTRLDYAEAVDERTVVVHLKEPYVFALEAFGLVPIVPKHIWENVDKWDWESSKVYDYGVGCGPFKFVEMVEGDYIRLVKNEDYWLEGKPMVDEIIIRVIDTEEARILAIKSGEADTKRYELIPAFLEAVKGDPNIELVEAVSPWDYVLMFNLNRWPLNETKFREAVAYAIDRDEIVEKAALGAGVATTTFVPASFFGTYWENPEAKVPEHNIEKAKQLLAELGFRDVDNDGILEYAPEVETPAPTTAAPTTPAVTPAPARFPWVAVAFIIVVIVVMAAFAIIGRRK